MLLRPSARDAACRSRAWQLRLCIHAPHTSPGSVAFVAQRAPKAAAPFAATRTRHGRVTALLLTTGAHRRLAATPSQHNGCQPADKYKALLTEQLAADFVPHDQHDADAMITLLAFWVMTKTIHSGCWA